VKVVVEKVSKTLKNHLKRRKKLNISVNDAWKKLEKLVKKMMNNLKAAKDIKISLLMSMQEIMKTLVEKL